jgi:sugar/nucleoside kinase (ribokinase family)
VTPAVDRPEPSVVVVGPLFVDTIFSGIARLPEPGEEVHATEVGWAPGGYAISALALHRLGVPTRVCGEVGDDLYGQALTDALAGAGVGTDFIRRDPASHTNLAVALNWAGDRGIVSYERVHTAPATWYTAALEGLAEGSILYLAARHPLAAALVREARRRGMEVALSLSWQPEFLRSWQLRDLLPECDMLFCNVPEALMVTQEQSVDAAGERLVGTVPEVVITRGPEGANLYLGTRRETAAATPVVLVDATGAGDVFASTYVATRLWGLEPLSRLHAANWAAAQAIGRVGGGTAAVTRPSLEAALARLGRAGSLA